MALQAVTPAIQSPNGLQDQNTRSSLYAATYSDGTSFHIREAVESTIHRTAPEQFMDLQVLKRFGTMSVPGDEWEHSESPWARNPCTVVTGAVATAVPAATTTVTQDLVVSEASTQYFRESRTLIYPDGSIGVVKAINDSTNTITVESQFGVGLPAVADGAILTDGGVAGADGTDTFYQHQKLTTVQFSSLLEKIGPRTLKWDEIALQKRKNLGQTNFLQEEMRTNDEQMLVDHAQHVWLMKGGKYRLPGGEEAKHMNGIIPTLADRGTPFVTATSATAWDVMTEAVFATDHTASGGVRFAFGTPRNLHYLNVQEKGELVRYTADSRVRDLDLSAWKFSSHTLVLVPVQLWQDVGTFPAIYRDRVAILDLNQIKMLSMQGIPLMRRFTTMSRLNNDPGSIYDYIITAVQVFGGVQVKNGPAHIVMDISW